MIETFTFKTMTGSSFYDQAHLRKKEFIDRQAWDGVRTHDSMEFDEFDTPVAHYVLVRDDRGRARACCRLLPTTSPYMVETLWPEFLDRPAPKSPKLFENTRFMVDQSMNKEDMGMAWLRLSIGYMDYLLDLGANQALFFGAHRIFRQGLERKAEPFIPLGEVKMFDGEAHMAIKTQPFSRETVARMRQNASFWEPAQRIEVAA